MNMRIDQVTKKYFDQIRASNSAIRISDIHTEDSDEMKETKRRLKEWAESPAGKLVLSKDAKKISEYKKQFQNHAQTGENTFKGIDTSGLPESAKREIKELEEFIRNQQANKTEIKAIQKSDDVNPFTETANDFRKLLNEPGMTLGLYEYSDGLDESHINLEAIDKLEEKYQSYKKTITDSYFGDEREELDKKAGREV